MKHLLALLVCCSISLSLDATTYYLDQVEGSNTNDGLTENTAWKDLFKIAGSSPQPGDIYLLKRGSVWVVNQWYIGFSGSAGGTVKISTYGNAQDNLPVITNVNTVVGALTSGNWTLDSGNTWTLSLAESPGRLFLDGSEVLRANTLATLGVVDNEGATGFWYYDADADLLYLQATGNPASTFTAIDGSAVYYATLVGGGTYLEFDQIDFQGGNGVSLGILGGQHITVKNCQLGKNGASGILLLNSGGTSASNNTIHDNIFDSDFTFYYGTGSARGCEDGIRLRNGASNCQIYNNTFKNWAHNAIELLGDSPSAGGVNDNQIYDNYITAPDIPYAHPIGVDGISGKCQNNEIYRNQAFDCRTASQLNGNNNWYHHNVFRKMRRSPSKEQATAHGISIGVYVAGLVCENNRYDHNLIVDTDEAGFLVRGYGLSGTISNNSFRNNIAYETGKAPYDSKYDVGTAFIIYDTDQDVVANNVYQNNLFYNASANDNPVQIQSAYYTAAEFNQANGNDGNMISNNVDFDPLFNNANSGNYTPADNSLMINAGIDVGLTVDLALNPRIVGPSPDIGPYESSLTAPLPVEWLDVSVTCADQERLLRWRVGAEDNNRGFTVERSIDLRSWQTLGEVPVSPNPSESYEYRFTDSESLVGVLYYRVRQDDWDGQYTYSPIVVCEQAGESDLPFRVLTLSGRQFELQWAEQFYSELLSIAVFNTSGQLVKRIVHEPVIDLSDVPAGSYFIQVGYSGDRYSVPVIAY